MCVYIYVCVNICTNIDISDVARRRKRAAMHPIAVPPVYVEYMCEWIVSMYVYVNIYINHA